MEIRTATRVANRVTIKRSKRPLSGGQALGRVAIGVMGFGALAVGATAVGAVAIGGSSDPGACRQEGQDPTP
jgi:hypothetical protein